MPTNTNYNAIQKPADSDPMGNLASIARTGMDRVDELLGAKGAVVLDFGTIAAGASATLTVNMPGVLAGWLCSAYWNLGPQAGIVLDAYCANDGVVTVRACNFSNAAVDPNPSTTRIVARPY